MVPPQKFPHPPFCYYQPQDIPNHDSEVLHNGTTPIPLSIQFHPVVLGLNQAQRQAQQAHNASRHAVCAKMHKNRRRKKYMFAAL
jgi:hypothetical protein